MVLTKSKFGAAGFAAVIGIALLSSGGAVKADTYSPNDFLKLDLNQAVLSPKLLGPSAQFESVPIEAKADVADKADSIGVDNKATASSRATPVKSASVAAPVRRAHVASIRKPAHPHRNPLDAYAADTRIQVWPCKSGGICSWQK